MALLKTPGRRVYKLIYLCSRPRGLRFLCPRGPPGKRLDTF
jgi:hypothetical protein